MVNGKFSTGYNSKLGKDVGSLNRLALETCPGKSEWCKKNCYAKRGGFRYWKDEYGSELEMPDNLPEKVRFHSSGDFDSIEYIDWSIELVKNNPNTQFWAYTKSWRIEELKEELEKLRKLSNMTLFASMDVSIEEAPPKDWRVAWIETDDRKQGVKCLHDRGLVDSCSECGYCFNKNTDGDVIFKVK